MASIGPEGDDQAFSITLRAIGSQKKIHGETNVCQEDRVKLLCKRYPGKVEGFKL